MQKKHWFGWVSHGIVILFFGIMFGVIFIAFSRQSGVTGLNMGSIQKMRFEAEKLIQQKKQ